MPSSTQERKLTSKQQAFVNFYVVNGGNSLQAARDAGYSESTALARSAEFSENLGIQHAIEAKKRELASSGKLNTVSPEWVISKLAERASDDNSPASSVAALRTLADILGMTAGKQQALPAHVTAFMDFLAGYSAGQHASLPARTVEILPSSRPGDSEQEG